jgi:Porin subfamily
MKMVKSLLLGSATGLVAIAGAQAADLPVKAKPVQYVKICSLYGVGFYYIPGTDMCIKIGGWFQAQYDWNMNGSTTTGPFKSNVNDRTTNNSVWRMRGYITADARNQTAYGTVRAYLDVGFLGGNTGFDGGSPLAPNANRGFIQWAGFTFGNAVSFFDFYQLGAYSYLPSYPASTTGGAGWPVLTYTAQFGNGFSGSLGLEMRRLTQIIGQSPTNTVFAGGAIGTTFLTGAPATGGGYGGSQMPDVVGNLRVDQAWGSAQIMGAWHQVNAGYYGTAGLTGLPGHPGDESGWALGGGLKLNLPMIGHGDTFEAQVNYAEGASGYVFSPQISAFNWYYRDGNNAGYGLMSDAVYGGSVLGNNATGLNLTTAWGINAVFEHHWNDAWKTDIQGGYAEMNYNGQANDILCSLEGGGNGNGGVGTGAAASAGCDNSWNVWWVGSRTQWNVTPDFYLGVDVLYESLQSATAVNGLLPAAATAGGISTFVSNENTVSVEFRAHKDFYP